MIKTVIINHGGVKRIFTIPNKFKTTCITNPPFLVSLLAEYANLYECLMNYYNYIILYVLKNGHSS